MRPLLQLGTALYHTAIHLAAPFLPKARAWVAGRRGLWRRLEAEQARLRGCIWMHCASVGEFEQGRPLLETLRAERPAAPIVITFHSPSGYAAVHGTDLADHVEFLPADTAANARRMVALLQPTMVLWVKYEFWYHHLHALKAAGVPVFLVSAIFRRSQPFFRWYGGAYRRMLGTFRHLFVQDQASEQLLQGIGVERVTVSGDTRFDRVVAVASSPAPFPIVTAFKGDSTLLVCGSTWPADEARLLAGTPPTTAAVKWLVVPHELNEAHLAQLARRFPKPLVRWSELEGTTAMNVAATLGMESGGTLLVDRMGLLARLYDHGDVAYVGGGFGEGIHSILEPAAWGLPVVFGPRHHKFAEADGLVRDGGGFSVKSVADVRSTLGALVHDHELRHSAGMKARRYVMDHAGATGRILAGIREMTTVTPPVRS